MNEEAFISFVFENKLLWDKKNKEFKNAQKKKLVWESIGQKFGMTWEDTESYFKSIRVKYQREKKEETSATRNGAPASSKKPWHLKEQLRFLDDVIMPRRTFCSLKTKKVVPLPDGSGSSSCVPQIVENLVVGIQDDESNFNDNVIFDSTLDVEVHGESTDFFEDFSSPEFVRETSKSPAPLSVPGTSTPVPQPGTSSASQLNTSRAFIPIATYTQNKRRGKFSEPSYKMECEQLSEIATAMATPLLTNPVDKWNVKPRIEFFCKYLGERLNNLTDDEERQFELKIMTQLNDIESNKK